ESSPSARGAPGCPLRCLTSGDAPVTGRDNSTSLFDVCCSSSMQVICDGNSPLLKSAFTEVGRYAFARLRTSVDRDLPGSMVNAKILKLVTAELQLQFWLSNLARHTMCVLRLILGSYSCEYLCKMDIISYDALDVAKLSSC